MKFASSPEPTLGVEIELALVDADSMALTSRIDAVLENLSEADRVHVKCELMQCYIEINSTKCHTVAEVEADLRPRLITLERAAAAAGTRLLWSGTHPFSPWETQEVSQDPRYHALINLLQDSARQLVTFGLHVHVGVDSGDKAIMISDRIMRHLPFLLALSSNSPCWRGRVTGLHSWRSRLMDGLPTAGLPPTLRNWSEYAWLVNHLIEAGDIETIREIWWDVRPHHNFGTVEIRICDVPPNFDDTLGLVALVHALVKQLSDEIDRGTYQQDFHPMMVRQNKWRAARYGIEAKLVDTITCETKPVRRILRELITELGPQAQDLGCASYFERLGEMAEQPSGAKRQLAALKDSGGDFAEAVRALTQGSSLLATADGQTRR